ncbi:hypothetical protein C0995_010941 [Termitomyces sp. Mi166|nr:hypothetical protein C0995_010941 [Termitomyces sp. Mi166\
MNIGSLASLVVAPSTQVTASDIKNDITNKIAPALSNFLTTIGAFPISNGSFDQARALYIASSNLQNVLVATTNDIKSATSPVSASDGQDILTLFRTLVPNIKKASADIITRKYSIVGLPIIDVPALVQQNFTSLSGTTNTLTAAFIACVPKINVEQPNVVPGAKQLQSEIDAEFAKVMAALK